jgi:AAA family ATP:ADP antiporter
MGSSVSCAESYWVLRSPAIRAALLFTDFFLIILAYYQLKPASRSLFIESLGSNRLPYVWIAAALSMGLFIAGYDRLVERYSRTNVVLGTCVTVAVVLGVFRLASDQPGPALSTLLYVFVDIIGVVLVEQFWSLADSIFTTRDGKSWYGVVGSGGLVGGVVGGWAAAMLLKHTSLKTPDLLLTAAGTLLLLTGLTWAMGRVGLYCEAERHAGRRTHAGGGWHALRRSRYLLLIAAMLLLAQLAAPLVEYQFLSSVEAAYTAREARTIFLSMFFSVMGMVSIGVNLAITPIVHRFGGAIAGLFVQPLMMSLCAWGYLLQPTLFFSGAAKISDRALSYSINRASKELLYIPVDPVLIYQAKAWIDMFGYRSFKVLGSLLILLVTQWLPFRMGIAELSWFTIGICLAWIVLICGIRSPYRAVCEAER